MSNLLRVGSLMLFAPHLAGCKGPCADYAEDVGVCVDAYCGAEGADSALCGCWANGQDIDPVDCECQSLNLEATCDGWDLSSYQLGDFDCVSFTDALGGVCPG